MVFVVLERIELFPSKNEQKTISTLDSQVLNGMDLLQFEHMLIQQET